VHRAHNTNFISTISQTDPDGTTILNTDLQILNQRIVKGLIVQIALA
jgi:hypothetical protein